MEKEDIISGLKQALSRGDSLERAKQSFVNAGYPLRDVEDSVNFLTNSVSSLTTTNLPNIQTPYPKATQNLPNIPKYNPVKQAPQKQFTIQAPQPQIQQTPQQKQIQPPIQAPIQHQNKIPTYLPNIPQQTQSPQEDTSQAPEKQQSSNKLIIVLVIILVILLGVLGASLFFKDKILAFLGK